MACEPVELKVSALTSKQALKTPNGEQGAWPAGLCNYELGYSDSGERGFIEWRNTGKFKFTRALSTSQNDY